jgi:plastocyanin
LETGFEIPLTSDATKVQISATSNETNHSNKPQGESSQNVSTVKSSNQSAVLNSGLSSTANVEIPQGAYSVTNTEFYKPAIINIPRGATVTWTNNDAEMHTVTSGNLDAGGPTGTLFDSGPLPSGKTYRHTFSDKGIFDYLCTLHPFMKGKVIVK